MSCAVVSAGVPGTTGDTVAGIDGVCSCILSPLLQSNESTKYPIQILLTNGEGLLSPVENRETEASLYLHGGM